MPIDTSMYPPGSNAFLRARTMDQLVAPPTAKEMMDLSTQRVSLENAKILNRLDIMTLSDKENEQKEEVERRNYLLNAGKPVSPSGVPDQVPVPAQPQNALSPEWKGIPYAAPGGPSGPEVQPSPAAPVGAEPGGAEPGKPASAIPSQVSGPQDVQSFLSGADLPKPKSYGEFIAQQQLVAQRHQQFDEGHKRTMEEFKPIYQAIITSGDNDALKTLLTAAGRNPYLAGMANYLKDIKLTGPGETEMTSTLNQDQLNHFETIAATPEMAGIIRNSPPGSYKVKTKHGKVVQFDPASPEKSLTQEQLASKAVQEELKGRGEDRAPTAQEIIDKITQMKGEGRNKSEYEQAKAVVREQNTIRYLGAHGNNTPTGDEIREEIRSGRVPEPTDIEVEQWMFNRKKEVAKAGAGGKLEGTYESPYMQKQIEESAKTLLDGAQAPSQVRNAFGLALSTAAINRAREIDPGYNAIEAEANFQWYKAPSTQRLIRRTESIVSKDGAIAESLRMAKVLDQPLGTPMNKLIGKAGVALGNSRRQVLDLVTNISAEEQQQIFGAMGGGEKFLALAQSLADPNLSAEQYINAVKEIRYMIYTRQLANVRGTPAQKIWQEAFKEIEGDRPFLTDKEKRDIKLRHEKEKGGTSSKNRDKWVAEAKRLNPGMSLDEINKEWDRKQKGGK